MSRKTHRSRSRAHALVFAALGDPTRLALVATLSGGELHSIAQLTQSSRLTRGSRLTRQAITKHLHVLQHAGVVRCERRGRESLFAIEPEPLTAAIGYLESLSEQWDQALDRLKLFVKDKDTH